MPPPPARSPTWAAAAACPGLVLAIVRPEREVHLIEATARKATFIAETAEELGLTVAVHADRSEELARGPLRDAFACVVARALAPPPIAAELCLPLCRPGGRVVIWSREPATAELAFATAALGGSILVPEAPRRARPGQARGDTGALPAPAGHGGETPAPRGLIRPMAPVESSRCRGSTQWRTRRAASARRRPRSTSPHVSRRRAHPCSSSTSTPRPTPRAGSVSAPARPRGRPTTSCTASRSPTSSSRRGSRASTWHRRTPTSPRRRSSCPGARTAMP